MRGDLHDRATMGRGAAAQVAPTCSRRPHYHCMLHTVRLQRQSALPCQPSRSARRISLSVQAVCSPEAVFGAATFAVLPLYTLMTIFPHTKVARRVMDSQVAFTVMGGVYACLLAAWLPGPILDGCIAAVQSCAPLPNVQILANLMLQPRMTVLAWLHLLMLDLYQARAVFLDGCRQGVRTVHSIILCFMFGPLGLLSHSITKRLSAQRSRGSSNAVT